MEEERKKSSRLQQVQQEINKYAMILKPEGSPLEQLTNLYVPDTQKQIKLLQDSQPRTVQDDGQTKYAFYQYFSSLRKLFKEQLTIIRQENKKNGEEYIRQLPTEQYTTELQNQIISDEQKWELYMNTFEKDIDIQTFIMIHDQLKKFFAYKKLERKEKWKLLLDISEKFASIIVEDDGKYQPQTDIATIKFAALKQVAKAKNRQQAVGKTIEQKRNRSQKMEEKLTKKKLKFEADSIKREEEIQLLQNLEDGDDEKHQSDVQLKKRNFLQSGIAGQEVTYKFKYAVSPDFLRMLSADYSFDELKKYITYTQTFSKGKTKQVIQASMLSYDGLFTQNHIFVDRRYYMDKYKYTDDDLEKLDKAWRTYFTKYNKQLTKDKADYKLTVQSSVEKKNVSTLFSETIDEENKS